MATNLNQTSGDTESQFSKFEGIEAEQDSTKQAAKPLLGGEEEKFEMNEMQAAHEVLMDQRVKAA